MKQTVHLGHTKAPVDVATHAFKTRLDHIVNQQPSLRGMGQFYRAVLPLVQAAQEKTAPFLLDSSVARQKLQAGCPLLVGEALPVEEAHLRTLFLQICGVVEELGCGLAQPRINSYEKGGISRTLFAFFRKGEPDPSAAAQAFQRAATTLAARVAQLPARRLPVRFTADPELKILA